MHTPVTDVDAALFSSMVGGKWQRTYATSKANGLCMFVFQRRDDAGDIRVLRNDDACQGADEIRVPGYGGMFCHGHLNDPALAGLQPILTGYEGCHVLRYRPGKRITIAATDIANGPIIIKCVASGVMDIVNRLRAVWEKRSDLDFAVGRPIKYYPEFNTFVQARIPGVPIEATARQFDNKLAFKMANALRSLHCSNVAMPHLFATASQQSRSLRYARAIHARVPDLTGIVDRLGSALDEIGQRIRNRSDTFVPIHGSLHSHQWLIDGEQLALVDFDRAAMGQSELDIATFLAEFDYEPPNVGDAINRAFLAGFDRYDPLALKFYRAHKHLAKAFKASRSSDLTTGFTKTRRNLGRALRIVEQEAS